MMIMVYEDDNDYNDESNKQNDNLLLSLNQVKSKCLKAVEKHKQKQRKTSETKTRWKGKKQVHSG